MDAPVRPHRRLKWKYTGVVVALVAAAVLSLGLTELYFSYQDTKRALTRAERDYRAVALPLATAYESVVRLGPHTRLALVDDMWVAARREAESAAGVLRPGVAPRGSCCLLYALPGCVECAGCPRLRTTPAVER